MQVFIPDDATNADVLKLLYPNAELCGVCMIDKNYNIIFHDLNYHWLYSRYNESRGDKND